MQNKIDLNKRIAVVTGGGQGIGRAIVECLQSNGAQVVNWDIDQSSDSEDARLLTVPVDVSDREMVRSACKKTIDQFGRIDILVNNAGYGGPILALHEYPHDEWRRIMAINLDGPYFCCAEVVPHMRSNGWGRIVNIASLAGKEGTPFAGPYSISKAGVIALTKSMGKENAEAGILINCIAPAAIETAMLDQFTEKHVQIMIDKSPLKRLGTVQEVAALTAWLSSPDLSFSTGAVFDLSGGRATY